MSPNKIFLIFFCIIVLIGVIALIKIYRREKKLSWGTLKKELLRLPKFRIWLLVLSLAFVTLFSGFYQKYDSMRGKVIITLNYSEAHKGQNANGTRYNMNEIVCEDVLEKVIEMGAIEGITARELQSCLAVEPVVEGESGDEKNYHISTEFEVSYKGAGALNVSAENIVTLIGYAYKEYCIEHYADNFTPLDISINTEDFAELDYLDIVDYLANKVILVQNYMYGMAYKNASFMATNGETFYSLAAKCENLYNVQLQNNLKAYLLNNGVSKNAKEYIGRLEYNNTLLDYDYQKAVAGFDIRREAVSMYAEEMARIVLVPTWDIEGEYYMGRTKIGIDQLSVDAEESSQLAAEYFKEMETNASIIDAYSKTRRRGTDEYAETMIGAISNEIKSVAHDAQIAGQEYSETRMNRCVSVAVDDSSIIKFAIFAVGLYVLFYFNMSVLLRRDK